MKPSLRNTADRARHCVVQGRYLEAAELYRELIDADPHDPHWHQDLGETLRFLGRFTEAVQCYEQAIRIHSTLGDELKALELAKVILEIEPSRDSTRAIIDKLARVQRTGSGSRARPVPRPRPPPRAAPWESGGPTRPQADLPDPLRSPWERPRAEPERATPAPTSAGTPTTRPVPAAPEPDAPPPAAPGGAMPPPAESTPPPGQGEEPSEPELAARLEVSLDVSADHDYQLVRSSTEMVHWDGDGRASQRGGEDRGIPLDLGASSAGAEEGIVRSADELGHWDRKRGDEPGAAPVATPTPAPAERPPTPGPQAPYPPDPTPPPQAHYAPQGSQTRYPPYTPYPPQPQGPYPPAPAQPQQPPAGYPTGPGPSQPVPSQPAPAPRPDDQPWPEAAPRATPPPDLPAPSPEPAYPGVETTLGGGTDDGEEDSVWMEFDLDDGDEEEERSGDEFDEELLHVTEQDLGSDELLSRVPPIPLLDTLSRRELVAVIRRAEVRTFYDDDPIFREGDPGNSLFVIVEGMAEVTTVGPPPLELGTLHAGDVFGEAALLAEAVRTATVTAISDGMALEISRDVMVEVVTRHPDVLRKLLRFFRMRVLDVLVQTHVLFEPYAETDREALERRFTFVDARKGASLAAQGEPTDGLLVLLAGRAAVTRDGRTIGELCAGDLLGEPSLLTGQPSPISVEATTKCWLLRLDRATFNQLMFDHPRSLDLVEDLAGRFEQQLEALERGARLDLFSVTML